ncbi:hypothetical protein T484DRAFT_1971637 [Baffinella frigidus]|nr:hypothetical protein T484DRAFT_1971637 [Cryptophyta sp. CCMP2293]
MNARIVAGCDEFLSCIDGMRLVDAPAPALVVDPGTNNQNCPNVEYCDEFLSNIDDVRLIDASPSSSISASTIALINELEMSLKRMRTMCVARNTREQEVLAHKADVCSPTATACLGDLCLARDTASSSPTVQSEGLRSSPGRASSGVEDRRPGQNSPIPPGRAHDSPSLVWFDEDAVAAAAASPCGSRSGVKLAMANTIAGEGGRFDAMCK